MAAGVVLIGVYGSGKTSVCEEIAETLESAGMAYGAIDLDWLRWYESPRRGGEHGHRDPVALANLSAVVDNYLHVDVEHFVLAGAVWTVEELDAIRSTMPFPVSVVQLTLPYSAIEARLGTAVTTGRAHDLAEARHQCELDVQLADLVVANDRPIRVVADEILGWLGWITDVDAVTDHDPPTPPRRTRGSETPMTTADRSKDRAHGEVV